MNFNKLFRSARNFLLERPLRSHLTLLAFCTLLPMIAVAALTSAFLAQRERARFTQGAKEATVALLSAVDAELKSSLTTLMAMASLRSFDTDDLSSFYAEATRVAQTQPHWITIILLAPSGQQLVNLLRPMGAELPAASERASFEQVLRTGKPAIGALVDTKLTKGVGFTVRVPVIRDGVVKYVLSAGVAPKGMLDLLSSQKLPSGWVAGVVDQHGRIVARTREPERYVGQLASISLLDAVARASEGWFPGITLEGADVYTAYRRSDFSGWTLAIGIPAAEYKTGSLQTMLMIGGGTLGAGLLALSLAILFGRRITAPVSALVSAAKAMGRGEEPGISPVTGITEIVVLSRALKDAAEAVGEREKRFQLVADATPAMIWISGPDKRRTWFNKFWLDFVGRSLEHEIRDGWSENVHPDDVGRAMHEYSTAFDLRKAFAMEYRLLCAADTKYHWVFDQGVPHYRPDGEFAGFIGSAIDVTDRKEAQEALDVIARLPLENPAPVFRVSGEGTVLYSNPAAAPLLGDMQSDASNRVPEAISGAVDAALKTGVKRELELQCGGPDFSFVVAPVSERRYANLYGFDVTERKRAEEALRQADRRKDEFLAMLGHELRNPLGIISTSVQLLRLKGPRDPALIELREMIERQTEHMSQMMNDLLDVSRITRGQVRLKREPCDLAEIVRHAVEDHRSAIDESGLTLVSKVPDRPMWMMGDPMRLAQIVGNLLHNAGKFSDRGGTLTIRLVESPGGSVLLSVHDTGIGIETEMLKDIFEPFTQSDHSIDRSRGGLGMGLALVKGFVELHGGLVRVESAGLGCGSEFIVRLPLSKDHVSRGPDLSALKTPSEPSRRILIIEDNQDAARSIQMLLELAGHRVKMANTGSEGIQAAEQFRPEMVLCDIGLPGLDAYAVARQLRQQSELKGIYLVAISGYGQEADQLRARDAGFDVHLTKPISPDHLHEILVSLT